MSAKTYRDDPANVQLHKLAKRMDELRVDLLDMADSRKPASLLRDMPDINDRMKALAVFLEVIESDITSNLFVPTDAAMKLRKAS